MKQSISTALALMALLGTTEVIAATEALPASTPPRPDVKNGRPVTPKLPIGKRDQAHPWHPDYSRGQSGAEYEGGQDPYNAGHPAAGGNVWSTHLGEPPFQRLAPPGN